MLFGFLMLQGGQLIYILHDIKDIRDIQTWVEYALFW